MNRPRILKVFPTGAVVSLVFVGAIWLMLGQKAAEKIATALVMPGGIVWILLTCGLVMAYKAGQRKVSTLLSATWLIYTVCGNGLVSGWFAARLEAPFRAIQPLEEETFDVVVVLGGGASLAGNNRQQGNGSGDRLILAAQLYHQGLASALICTGTRIESMDSTGFDPAEQSKDVLVGLGVPSAAIEMLGGRTTSEEMQALGERFRNTDQRIGVVTSAWHLPRALSLARRNGLNPSPLPADFMCGPPATRTAGEIINACIPHGGAFIGISRIAKEYLGMLAGR